MPGIQLGHVRALGPVGKRRVPHELADVQNLIRVVAPPLALAVHQAPAAVRNQLRSTDLLGPPVREPMAALYAVQLVF